MVVKEIIDESDIEKIIPNYGNLDKDMQKKVKEQLYRTQFLDREIVRTLDDLIKKQREVERD